VLTVCATVPLLLLGAEVTTKQVGMVDPVGFRAPWHLLQNLERAYRELGFLIEHSHRLFGFMVGSCTIVLAVGLWWSEPRRWIRWLGVVALAGISLQGVLGILRVNQNVQMGRELALVHGCSAQLVFALLCSLALFTSRGWLAGPTAGVVNTQVRSWSIFLTGLVYSQIVLGAFVRHLNSPVAQRLHVLAAFAVVAVFVWLVKLRHEAGEKSTFAIKTLASLITLQVMVGVEAWIRKFGAGTLPELQPLTTGQEMVRTTHFLLGSAIFATSVMAALLAQRRNDLFPARQTGGVA
jgi:cytochrome c oxidase assembly protein subunit 15